MKKMTYLMAAALLLGSSVAYAEDPLLHALKTLPHPPLPSELPPPPMPGVMPVPVVQREPRRDDDYERERHHHHDRGHHYGEREHRHHGRD